MNWRHLHGRFVPALFLPERAAEHGDDFTGENFESEAKVTCGLCHEDIAPVYRRYSYTYTNDDGSEVISHNAHEHDPAEIKRWEKGVIVHNCVYSNFDAAERYLRRARNGYSRTIANNTSLIRQNEETIAIRLHATDIITLRRDGSISFSSGGWRTPTTSNRLNRVQGFFKWSERMPDPNPAYGPDSIWVISKRDGWQGDSPVYIFHDGITFAANGKADGELFDEKLAENKAKRAANVASQRKIRGRITAYTNRTMKALAEGLPVDQGHDTLLSDELRAIVESLEPSGPLTMRIIARTLPGDVREWLNFNECQGHVLMGDLAPVVEPIVRRKIAETLTHELVR